MTNGTFPVGLDDAGSPAIPPLTKDGQRRLNISNTKLFNAEATKAMKTIFDAASESVYLVVANANLGPQTPVMVGAWAQGAVRLRDAHHDNLAHTYSHRYIPNPSRTFRRQA